MATRYGLKEISNWHFNLKRIKVLGYDFLFMVLVKRISKVKIFQCSEDIKGGEGEVNKWA